MYIIRFRCVGANNNHHNVVYYQYNNLVLHLSVQKEVKYSYSFKSAAKTLYYFVFYIV